MSTSLIVPQADSQVKSSVGRVLQALPNKRRTLEGWHSSCPTCGKDSLVISEDGQQVECRASGCDPEDILSRLWGRLDDPTHQDSPAPVVTTRGPEERNPLQELNSAYSAYSAGTLQAPKWGIPIPFETHLTPRFPTKMLPGWLRDYVEAVAVSTQTPVDLPGMVGLTACSAAIGKVTTVAAGPDWWEPLNLYTLVSLPPASRKSAVFRLMTTPIDEYEQRINADRQTEIAQAEADKSLLEQRLHTAKQAAAKSKNHTDREKAASEVRQLTEELSDFRMPVPLRLVADDVTQEKLVGLLAEQGGRLAILSPEGGLFDLMAGRYSNNTPNLDVYLKAHCGDTIQADRVGRPSEYVAHPTLTLGLTIQPDILRGLAQKQGFRGRGLLARFLYALPPDNIGYRSIEAVSIPKEVAEAYTRGLECLLNLTPGKTEDGQPHPLVLNLAPDAHTAFQKFQAVIETALRPDGELGGLRDWGGKLCGAVMRIAGILHLCEHGDTERTIGYDAVFNAIEIGKYLTAHAKAAFCEMGLDEDTDHARSLLAWIQHTQVATFTKRDAFNALRVRIPQATGLDSPLTRLCERGYIREVPKEDIGGPGRKPSPEYAVNPCLMAPHNTHNTHNSPVTLTATVTQQARAHEIARRRQEGKETRKPEGDLGSPEANYEADYYGALAEICLYEWLEANGKQPAYTLVADRPVTASDMELDGVKFEVKSCPPGKEYLNISQRQHKDERRRCDYYLPVVYDAPDQMRLCATVPYETVGSWNLHTGGHEPCYGVPHDQLRPLNSLHDLPVQKP